MAYNETFFIVLCVEIIIDFSSMIVSLGPWAFNF